MDITQNINGEHFVLVLSGTTEGREVCERLSKLGYSILASVISDYGAQLIEDIEHCQIQVGKMDLDDMIDCLYNGAFCVIDATHPYAKEVTANAKKACDQTGIPYIRLKRQETVLLDGQIKLVDHVQEAIEYLEQHTQGNILLTTGSNALRAFTQDSVLRERLYVRILPDLTSLKKAFDARLRPDQIIAMKGPFSTAMNIALIQELQINCLVTKDGGQVGGMPEKLEAAKYCHIETVVLRRPEELGYDIDTVVNQVQKLRLEIKLPAKQEKKQKKNTAYPVVDFFPFFVNIKNWKAVIVGGGKVAMRRANALLQAGASIIIIAPYCIEQPNQKVLWKKRDWQTGDTKDADIVLAATDDHEVNEQVIKEAKKAKFYNACDDPTAGNFYFPAILRKNSMILGMISGEPKKTKKWMNQLKTDWLFEDN